MSPDASNVPTPRDHAGIHRNDAICNGCGRWAVLDLPALVASGYGNVPLIRLPLRCGVCGQPYECRYRGDFVRMLTLPLGMSGKALIVDLAHNVGRIEACKMLTGGETAPDRRMREIENVKVKVMILRKRDGLQPLRHPLNSNVAWH